jgi:transcription initiation factor TFIIB
MSKTIQQIEENLQCPECHSHNLSQDQNRAEVVCNRCGYVIDSDLIDYGPEWRAFDHEQYTKRAHIGAPINPLLQDKGLSTEIGWKNVDYRGVSIPYHNRAQLYRLRRWNRRTRVSNAIQRNITQAISSITQVSSRLGLPRTIRETAAFIYRKATLNDLVRGRRTEGMAAAALYAACRQCNLPRTLDEIVHVTNASRTEVGRGYRHLSKELHLKLLPTAPQDYLPRFGSQLQLSNDILEKAKDILNEADAKNITNGRGPTGLATAALYIASILCNKRTTQKKIADTIGVTEVTIRNRYKELSGKLGIPVDV